MIYIIQGPTASGKTELAIALAERLRTDIISADSRQFYKELSIGTAKPNLEELDRVKHHFIGNRSITNPMNVAEYETEATAVANDLIKQKGIVVLVGGSAQFVDALIFGNDNIPVFPEIKLELNQQLAQKGIESLTQTLKQLDPQAHQRIDIKNTRRVIRALEVRLGTGVSILDYQTVNHAPKFSFKRIVIELDRKTLYDRINMRVDKMLSMGLEKEAQNLINCRHLSALNTVGYKEWWDYFDKTTSYDSVVNNIKQHSRNYAKRQVTWLRKYADAIKVNPLIELNLEGLIDHIISR